MTAQKREISNGKDKEEVCRDSGAKATKPEVGLEQTGELISESLEVEHHKLEY